MNAFNVVETDKSQNFLPPPAIFLSEATSDGEDTADDVNVNQQQGPRLVRCEAVLTDVEYSSDEDEYVRKNCASPIPINCSSESQVVERVYQKNEQFINDELTDTENVCASDDDELQKNCNDVEEKDVDLQEDGVTTISDKIKSGLKTRNRFDTVQKESVTKPHMGKTMDRNRFETANNKNFLVPVNKLAKKKKRKGKLLLDSCLTDTEDVDVPSDVDDINRVSKNDVSYSIYPSEKDEQEYTNRIKHTSLLRDTEKFTLLEFLSNKLDDGGVTDVDDLMYSDCEDMPGAVKDTEYELDFSNEISNKEKVIHGSAERKVKKKRSVRSTPESCDTDDEDAKTMAKHDQRVKANETASNNRLAIKTHRKLQDSEDISIVLTDTEDVNYSDGECGSSRPKCPTPDLAFYESSTVSQNESLKIMKALEGISDAEALSDCEEIYLTPSPRKSKKNAKGSRTGDGLTDTEELFLSDGNARYSETSDTGDSCTETDVELYDYEDSNNYRVMSVTPDCLRHLDNTYISNVEGSESYLKQIKGNKCKTLTAPPAPSSSSPAPEQEVTDSEELQTEDETAEEFTYNRACTPSNYFEKFTLEDESCVIHEKSTRSFQTDGAESLHIKDGSYQDPVTDSEDVPLID